VKHRVFLALFGWLAAAGAASTAQPRALAIALAQVGTERTISANLEKVLSYTRRAAAAKARVVVFPEGTLTGETDSAVPTFEAALARVSAAAKACGIYVVLGGASAAPGDSRTRNWMVVFDPGGRRIFAYDKLFDKRGAPLPNLFEIDGIPCSAMICADRWLRGVEELPIMNGAQISFELSNNFRMEWVDPFGWYWYVPRALRNGVYVVFSNSAFHHLGPGHGHSAVIAPDGRIVAAAQDNAEQLLVHTIDVARATRAEALRRRHHPALKELWETGLQVLRGAALPREVVTPLSSPETEITIAGVQMAASRDMESNLRRMESYIRAAAANRADIAVFPELAVTGALQADIRSTSASRLNGALERLQASARAAGVYVIFGMPRVENGARTNAAYVLGPDGNLLTRYDQMAVDRPGPFVPGADPKRMWFRVKGVPAVVTVGRDALWSEIAEMAAIAGAQLQFQISYEAGSGPDAALRRLQVWSNAASFRTFTAAMNAADPRSLPSPSLRAGGGSILWDDLRGLEETRIAVQYGSRKEPVPVLAEVLVDSPFSANCIARAGAGEQILYATRRVRRHNSWYADRTVRYTPQLAGWFSLGARTLGPPPGF
jgi:predicted amidohydrolase